MSAPPPPPDEQRGQSGYPPPHETPERPVGAEPQYVAPGQVPPGQAPPEAGGPYGPQTAAPSGGNGLAVGALVCGILALLTGLLGIFLITLPLALILGITAIVLGIMGNRRAATSGGAGRGQSIAGLITGALGLVAMLGWAVLLAVGYSTMVDEFGNPFQDPEGFQERLEEFEELEEPTPSP